MSDFDNAFEITMKHEGGYVNDPDDPGGETYMGISRKNHPNWSGWETIDSYNKDIDLIDDIDHLSGHVKDFYFHNYWQPLYLFQINDNDIASFIFDCAINHGLRRAGYFFQQAMNLTRGKDETPITEDGIVGNKTINVANREKNPSRLLIAIKGERYIFFRSLSRQDLSNGFDDKWGRKFFRNWISRLN